MMTHWTDEKPHTWDNRRGGQHFTDEQIADRVRMLMRTDFDHEATCTLARDRIASLARERDQLREFVEQLARGEVTARAQSSVVAANDLLNAITRERSTNVFQKAASE